jgi:uncharacterized protein YbjT (DUF2867 family)
MHVLVYGATGTQGGPVARRLLDRGDQVRVLTREPASAGAWKERGAQIARADLRDGSGLAAAHDGIDAVFVQISASVAPGPDPGAGPGRAERCPARRGGSCRHDQQQCHPAGPHRGRGARRAGRAARDGSRRSCPARSVLRPTLLWTTSLVRCARRWTAESVPQGIPADVRVAYISAEDQAAYAVAALDRPELAGELLPIAGADALTGPELAAALGQAMGKQLTYVSLSQAEVREALAFTGEDVAAAVAEMYAWEGTEGADQLAPDLTRTRDALGVTPTPLADWAASALAPAAVSR